MNYNKFLGVRNSNVEIFDSNIIEFNKKCNEFNKSILGFIELKNNFLVKLNDGIKHSNQRNGLLTKVMNRIQNDMENLNQLLQFVSLNEEQINILSKLSNIVVYPSNRGSFISKAEYIIQENPIDVLKVSQIYRCKSCDINDAKFVIKISESSPSFDSRRLKCDCGPSICGGCFIDQFWDTESDVEIQFPNCKGCNARFCLGDVHIAQQQIVDDGQVVNNNNQFKTTTTTTTTTAINSDTDITPISIDSPPQSSFNSPPQTPTYNP